MCDCIIKLNEVLKKDGKNTRIVTPILFTGIHVDTKAIVATEKADSSKREKPIKFFATFCPFCGVKYPEPIPEAIAGEEHGKVE